MTINAIPVSQWQSGAAGKGIGVDIPVSGIKTGDLLLAVVGYKAGTEAKGFDPSEFVVANGKITNAATSTDTYKLQVIWTHAV